ncbi:hypothetical protein CBM2587_A10275 [Cupriavidus taiwanensis]|uniref:Uncharacterized protein n=1 Tax=Cupriavidus taiwanensis TaxID=164546 RepID=A0A975WR57_9BURK|nr:hypothetical protein CBM2587_A10275 [Cupriavidus taiwanensis]
MGAFKQSHIFCKFVQGRARSLITALYLNYNQMTMHISS